MSMELQSASRVTPRIVNPDRLIRAQMMKTKRSLTIATMMMHFRKNTQLEYTKEDLTNLGIGVTSLSSADELLTGEGPFRPYFSFPPDVLKQALRGEDATCLDVERQRQFENDLESRGFDYMDFDFPWRDLQLEEKFFGVLDGVVMDIEGSPPENPMLTIKAWSETRYFPYLEPEVLKSLEKPPPHVHIRSYSPRYNDDELTRYELTAAVTAIHNRLYQKGFEHETLFPVILFTICPNNRMRMTEFIFDLPREKLSLRITPIHEFDDPETAPWETFIQMYASTPRVLSAQKK